MCCRNKVGIGLSLRRSGVPYSDVRLSWFCSNSRSDSGFVLTPGQTLLVCSNSRSDSGFVLTPGQFTGCAFGSAAIWQYESLKSRVQSYFDQVQTDWLEETAAQKRGDLRKDVNQWWSGLSEGQRTVTGIIALNVLVFCCWRIPALQRTMIRYFTADPASSECLNLNV
uniref:Uncharacterized protein n=1 Tax=Neogobius melanostomus TaxID=47308 RepID=A0A8C6WGC9_9GOBI